MGEGGRILAMRGQIEDYVAVVSKSGNPCGESSDWQESLLRWAGSRCHGRLLACHRSGFVTSSPLSELAQRAVLLLSFAT